MSNPHIVHKAELGIYVSDKMKEIVDQCCDFDIQDDCIVIRTLSKRQELELDILFADEIKAGWLEFYYIEE